MLVPAGSVTQTCYVAKDLEATVAHWARMVGAGPFYLLEFPASLQKTYRGQPAEDSFKAAIGFSGTAFIEFLQPTNDAPSIIREVLDSRGDGALHHLYPNITPLDAAGFDALCAQYRSQGLEEALTCNVPGTGRNAFFDATETLGCFLEVLEFNADMYASMTRELYDLHRSWDQRDPLRRIETLQAAVVKR